ncbi:MAG: efflux RND transporter periplasmic adaptor subunit [bacterium]|nr:efflux RND transporter periplasmic adaptor subunit [bacterium]
MSKLHGRLPRTLLLLLLLTGLPLTGLALTGCSNEGEAAEANNEEKSGETKKKKGEEDEDGEKKEEELPPVEVVSLAHGPIEAVLRFSTNLEAESEVQVFSQAARQITSLKVEEGDLVRKGQVLVRLQDEEQRSELARIESQLEKARREYKRQENLFAQELVSEQAINDATYEVEQLELALGDAKRNLGYTEVLAPIAGTITGRHVNIGDHITVNQHLFDLVDFDSIVARVYVPEKELVRLGVGLPARLYSASIGGDARTGEVIRVAPIVDPKSGTVKVTVGIPRSQELLPGMYVEVELVTDTRDNALLVPKRAVIYDQNQAFLYRLEGSDDDLTAERLRVGILLEDREHIMPSEDSDVAAGDRIVVAGQAGLKDGAKVRLAGQKRPSEDVDGEEADAGADEEEEETGEVAAEVEAS